MAIWWALVATIYSSPGTGAGTSSRATSYFPLCMLCFVLCALRPLGLVITFLSVDASAVRRLLPQTVIAPRFLSLLGVILLFCRMLT